jgi:hypothetical protein
MARVATSRAESTMRPSIRRFAVNGASAMGWLAAGLGVALALAFCVVMPGLVRPARALPSFARQTGYECAVCHVAFPELTPIGRLFKLKGYTTQGGDSPLPPIAGFLVPAFTHTERGQPGGIPPNFGANDNFAIQQASLFYGGAISSEAGLGAFAQVTYDSASNRFGWDNTDIRFARTGSVADKDFVAGLTLNNNPTVQDVWNTTPAWRFPFESSTLAPAPAAATLIENRLQHQVGGLGGYVFWNNLLFAEIDGYRTLSTRTLTTLGVNSSNIAAISGVAPYWRVALQPSWDKHSLEIGTFGLTAALSPQRVTGSGSDRVTDIGVDAQYQFIGERDQISLQASWIHEDRHFNASQTLGLTANDRSALRSLNVKTSYFYDHTYGLNLGYFNIAGKSDPVLFAPNPITGSANGSPNSSGWIVEADYVPFMHGGPSFWPWFNVRFQLQYVIYDKFNGGRHNYDGFGRNASDNNTLFFTAWMAF